MAPFETTVVASSSSDGDPFWWEDPGVLLRMDRVFEFYPAITMTPAEKLNSIMRFGIYGSVVLFVYLGDIRAGYVGFAAALFTWLMFHGRPETFRSGRGPAVTVDGTRVPDRLEDVSDPLATKTAHLGFIPTVELPENADKPFLTRPGLVDSFGSSDRVPPSLVRRPDGTVCVAPTRNNPYMNVLMSDYTDAPDRPAACTLSDADVLKKADEHASHNLYRDVSDLFGTMTHTRNFYTMPSTTIPNDREAFAKYCFGDVNKGCKAGHVDACIRNVDLRQQRGTVDEVSPMMAMSNMAAYA